MSTFPVVIAGAAVTPSALVSRTCLLGPQSIVLNGQIYELLSPVDGDDTTYVAFSPHNPGLHIVQPYDGQAMVVDAHSWGDRRVRFVTKLRARAVLQCVAEQAPDDIETWAGVYAEGVVVTGLQGAGSMFIAELRELLSLYAIPNAASLEAMLTPHTRSNSTEALTLVITTLARTLSEKAREFGLNPA